METRTYYNIYVLKLMHYREFSANMYEDGYKNLTNIDFSGVVIKDMQERYKAFPEMSCWYFAYPHKCLLWRRGADGRP